MTKKSEVPSESLLQTSRWMAFTGKFFISGSFSVIYTYTAELFPTNVRTVGLGLGSLGGGLGGIVAPYILTFQAIKLFYSVRLQLFLQKPPISIKWLPAAIFSVTCIMSAFFLLLLPETKGQPLYESVADADRAWSRDKTKKNINKEETTLLDETAT